MRNEAEGKILVKDLNVKGSRYVVRYITFFYLLYSNV